MPTLRVVYHSPVVVVPVPVVPVVVVPVPVVPVVVVPVPVVPVPVVPVVAVVVAVVVDEYAAESAVSSSLSPQPDRKASPTLSATPKTTP